MLLEIELLFKGIFTGRKNGDYAVRWDQKEDEKNGQGSEKEEVTDR